LRGYWSSGLLATAGCVRVMTDTTSAGGAPPEYSMLYQALMSQARASGFALAEPAAQFIVDNAIRNIRRQSTDAADTRAAAERAVAVLPEVVAKVVATTPQRRFEDAESVRAYMQSAACDCPWPWGPGR